MIDIRLNAVGQPPVRPGLTQLVAQLLEIVQHDHPVGYILQYGCNSRAILSLSLY